MDAAAAELEALKAEVALLRSAAAAAAAPTAAPAAEAACDWAGDSRWTLTQEELGWCAELVAALAAENIPRPTPDLLLAQFAIVGKGQTKKLVERVKNYNKVIVAEHGCVPAAAELLLLLLLLLLLQLLLLQLGCAPATPAITRALVTCYHYSCTTTATATATTTTTYYY